MTPRIPRRPVLRAVVRAAADTSALLLVILAVSVGPTVPLWLAIVFGTLGLVALAYFTRRLLIVEGAARGND